MLEEIAEHRQILRRATVFAFDTIGSLASLRLDSHTEIDVLGSFAIYSVVGFCRGGNWSR